jgi:hypothetical protein
MPTVLHDGPYRFYFYASDRDEPVHIHVERDDDIAKFWLEPVRLHSSKGFGRTELARVQRLIERHREQLVRAWNEFFGA